MNKQEQLRYLHGFQVHHIIDALPENYPLYKDSGRWQVRTDNMDFDVTQQDIDESFSDFIYRYAIQIMNQSQEDNEEFQMNLATTTVNDYEKNHKLH